MALAGLAICFWILGLYLFRPSILRTPGWYQSGGLLVRLFAFSLAISFSLQFDPLAQAVDQTAGINNLSWLLGYITTITGVVCGFSAWVRLRTQSVVLLRRGALIGLTFIFLLLGTFPWLAQDPQHLRSELPHTLAQLLTWSLTSVFYWVMAYEGARLVRPFLQDEFLPSAEIRLRITLWAFRLARVFAIARGMAVVSAILPPLQAFDPQILLIRDLAIFACALCLMLAAAPLQWLRRLGNVWLYFDNQRACAELSFLRAQLAKATQPIPWKPPSLYNRLFQPSLVLYFYFIDILDRDVLLKARLQRPGPAPSPRLRQIHQDLMNLPQDDDWMRLIPYLRDVATRRRKD